METPLKKDIGGAKQTEPGTSKGKIVLTILIGVAVILALLLLFMVWQFRSDRAEITAAAFDAAAMQAISAAETLDEVFEQAMSVADALADDLSTGALPYDQIEGSLSQILTEQPAIDGMTVAFEPYAFSAEQMLHSVYVYRDENEVIAVQQGERSSDYTEPSNAETLATETSWYLDRIDHGASWSEPFKDPGSDKILIQYGVPFYRTDSTSAEQVIAGVITQDYDITNMQHLVADLDLGMTGFGAVYSASGVWLAHPISENVANQTLYDSAQFQNDPELAEAAERAMQGEANALERADQLSEESVWNFFAPFETTGWTLIIQLSQAEFLPDAAETLKEVTRIILIAAALLFLVLAILLRVDQAKPGRLWVVVAAFTIIGLAVIISLITLSWRTPNDSGVTIVNRSGLNSYLENVQDEFSARGLEPPVKIPTGVLIQAARFPDPGAVVVNGYVWQRVPKIKGTEINAGFTLPQMIDEPFSTEEITREERENETLIVWSVIGTLRQVFDPLEYPFDRHDIKIRIAAAELKKFTLLVPDIESYDVTNPDFLPGLDSDLRINNWNIMSSSYRFNRHQFGTTLGIPGRPTVDIPELSFDINTQRRFLGPFISFLLPALVGAAMIFAFLLYDTKPDEPEEIVIALSYTAALFFVIAVMHTALRDDAAAIGLTYLEYFYLLLYVMVIFVAVNTFIVVNRPNHRLIRFENNLITKLLYWPVVVLVMLVATLVIFVY